MSAFQGDWLEQAVPDRSHDFGTVAQGSKLQVRFPIRNLTETPLRIVKVEKGCGCTRADLPIQILPPRTQTHIELTIDTTQFQGDKPYKQVGVTLYFDQPQTARVELRTTCFVRPTIRLEPGLADFGRVLAGSSPERRLTLIYLGAKTDWKILNMDHFSANLSAETEGDGRPSAEGKRFEILVKLDPETEVGTFRDRIRIQTNDPQNPVIPLDVRARIDPPVQASPSILRLGRIPVGSKLERTILVRAQTPFQIQSLVAPAELKTTVPLTDPGTEGRSEASTSQRLGLTFEAPSRVGAYFAEVRIITDLDALQPARLRVFATIVPE